MEIFASPSFKRSFKKLHKIFPDLDTVFEEKINIFRKNPHDPVLRNHKLHGELKDLRAFSVAFDLRVTYYLDKDNIAVLVDIGDHNKVY